MRSGFSKETDSKLGVVNLYHLQVNYRLLFKVVRNSFPFSIPAELYERLTRL